MSLILPVVLVSAMALMASLALFAVATRRETGVEPATVDPFLLPDEANPSDDTLPHSESLIKTQLVENIGWKTTVLPNLAQVEDMLDALESQGVTNREVVVLGNAAFAVRWK